MPNLNVPTTVLVMVLALVLGFANVDHHLKVLHVIPLQVLLNVLEPVIVLLQVSLLSITKQNLKLNALMVLKGGLVPFQFVPTTALDLFVVIVSCLVFASAEMVMKVKIVPRLFVKDVSMVHVQQRVLVSVTLGGKVQTAPSQFVLIIVCLMASVFTLVSVNVMKVGLERTVLNRQKKKNCNACIFAVRMESVFKVFVSALKVGAVEIAAFESVKMIVIIMVSVR